MKDKNTKEIFLLLLVLFAAVFACYGNVLNSGFIWDDEFLVRENPLVRAPLWSLEHFKQDIYNSRFTNTVYYRPLQVISYAVDYRIWGMNPAGFHLSSILLHYLNGVLVFLLIKDLSGKNNVAFITALFFIINPVNQGVVSYVSGRSDGLFLFFGLLSMLSFVLFRKTGRKPFQGACALLLVFSVLSKEIAVIIPLLILLMDILLLREYAGMSGVMRAAGSVDRAKTTGVRDHSANMAVSVVYLLAHYLFLGDRYTAFTSKGSIFGKAFDLVLMIKEYFMLGMIPVSLHMRRSAVGGAGGLFSLIFISALIILIIAYFRKEKLVLFSLGFFIISLAPLVLVLRYFNVLAEHWMYMSGIGLFLLSGTVICRGFEAARPYVRAVSALVMFFAVILYSGMNIKYNDHWTSDMALSEHILAFSRYDQSAMNYKILSLVKEGAGDRSREMVSEYTDKYPEDTRAWYIKGRVDLVSGDLDAAVKAFERSVELNPAYSNGYLGLSFAYYGKNNYKKALSNIDRVLGLDKMNYEAYGLMTKIYSNLGDQGKALAAAKKAREANPYNYDTIVDLGTAYCRSGLVQAGAMQYIAATRLYPEKPVPYYNLAYVFYLGGEQGESKKFLKAALEKEPNFKPALILMDKMKDDDDPGVKTI